MTEAEFVAHFAAVLNAVPTEKVSAREAALCCLQYVHDLQDELARRPRLALCASADLVPTAPRGELSVVKGPGGAA